MRRRVDKAVEGVASRGLTLHPPAFGTRRFATGARDGLNFPLPNDLARFVIAPCSDAFLRSMSSSTSRHSFPRRREFNLKSPLGPAFAGTSGMDCFTSPTRTSGGEWRPRGREYIALAAKPESLRSALARRCVPPA